MTVSDRPIDSLFSYGTLQLEAVQIATFGRRLDGEADALSGYAVVPLAIEDESVVAVSGQSEHTMARHTGRSEDRVHGVVFLVTESELAQADAYEVPAVRRTEVVLDSGRRAWTYLDARASVSE